MSSEEDDLPFGGPPPDPSQRQWRHPSEIAAAAAAAARYESGDAPGSSPLRGFSATSFLIGSSVGIAACLAVYAVLSSGTSAADGERVAFPTPTTETTIPADNDSPAPLGDEIGDDEQTNTTHTATTAALSVRQPLPPHLEAVVSELLVAVHVAGHHEPVGSGLLVDGVILTSAAAVGSASGVTLEFGGHRYAATVVGTDEFTDLAVLLPASPLVLPANSSSPLVDPETDPAAPPTPALDGITITLVATDGQPEPIAVTGRVVAVNQTVRSKAGGDLVGVFQTSARLPERGLGAILVDDVGDVKGIVIDGEGYLATGIPLAAARQIASNLITKGWASEVWIGIEGKDLAPGVEIISVEEAGPASRAGFQVGDVIHSVDDTPVADMVGLVEQLRRLEPGDEVDVRIERGWGTLTLTLTVADYRPAVTDTRAGLEQRVPNDEGEALSAPIAE